MAGYMVPDASPDAPHRRELLIKKSRFLVSMAHTSSSAEAKAFIERIKNEFPDATHNCWAFAAGAPGDTARVGSSDDGEPHGTAGRPMLTILTHSAVGEIAAVVTRYFGGIKLGTGGLVRAYQDMIKLGLETLPVCEHMTPSRIRAVIRYADIPMLMRMLPRYRAMIASESFDSCVSYNIVLPQEHIPQFVTELQNTTDGTAVIEQ